MGGREKVKLKSEIKLRRIERIPDSEAESKIRKGDSIICRGRGKGKIFKGMYVPTYLPEKATIRRAVMVQDFECRRYDKGRKGSHYRAT